MALAKSLYSVPTWTRIVALVREHVALRTAVVGARGGKGDVPSIYACYRFATKLRTYGDQLAACLDCVTAALHAQRPETGQNLAIDGSDMPAYANGQRVPVEERPGARALLRRGCVVGPRSAVSTRKGGGFYGYKVHAAVCTATGLPVAWTVQTAKDAETIFALPLIDTARERGFVVPDFRSLWASER